ncbi:MULTISPECIES: hypothetical protein [unclassified Tolypothrix]|uniref:hypothetical protein n=1 Tax=unclassified Tolypothrix TaxID=2649714 RepID=UPI0005EABEBC|nr:MULTISPECIES: hypothetical protein [unclassified Tolypothrix]EKF00491.1 hypothetical protein FDUTEX481_08895 [Tolypothrix sp. PCC 7601]MBE9086358.1 hypothetical protein [Tolypothrix sp. LEGE 11397]UYD28610.1 hypothetical protein HGR01_11565 [Tolypothrix sp. PCC 7712]UYD35481.1 hypothetical protein HG267_06810 [Tolypothrix sp. PCC 7601]
MESLAEVLFARGGWERGKYQDLSPSPVTDFCKQSISAREVRSPTHLQILSSACYNRKD